MSKITATKYHTSSDWEIDIIPEQNTYIDLYFAFRDNSPTVDFKDLKFGYELKTEQYIVSYDTFPPPGVRYVCSNQSYLENTRMYLDSKTVYSLFLWVEHNSQKFDKIINFHTNQYDSIEII